LPPLTTAARRWGRTPFVAGRTAGKCGYIFKRCGWHRRPSSWGA
jgi:hypothetical protein